MNHLFESGVYSIYKWNIFQPLQKKPILCMHQHR